MLLAWDSPVSTLSAGFARYVLEQRYGQRVTVIALPPPAVFLSPRGLDHVGPRAFGYDIEFRSVFDA